MSRDGAMTIAMQEELKNREPVGGKPVLDYWFKLGFQLGADWERAREDTARSSEETGPREGDG
jgi:hypothetical protein